MHSKDGIQPGLPKGIGWFRTFGVWLGQSVSWGFEPGGGGARVQDCRRAGGRRAQGGRKQEGQNGRRNALCASHSVGKLDLAAWRPGKGGDTASPPSPRPQPQPNQTLRESTSPTESPTKMVRLGRWNPPCDGAIGHDTNHTRTTQGVLPNRLANKTKWQFPSLRTCCTCPFA